MFGQGWVGGILVPVLKQVFRMIFFSILINNMTDSFSFSIITRICDVAWLFETNFGFILYMYISNPIDFNKSIITPVHNCMEFQILISGENNCLYSLCHKLHSNYISKKL